MASLRSETVGITPGDTHALETFFVSHYDRLIRLACLECGGLGSAEDIVQTALEHAWRSRAVVWADAELRPWLDRIVVREAARERRARLTRLSRLIRPPAVVDSLGGSDGRRRLIVADADGAHPTVVVDPSFAEQIRWSPGGLRFGPSE